MIKCGSKVFLNKVIVLILGSFLCALLVQAQSESSGHLQTLTPEERAWLEGNPIVDFCMTLDAAPYCYLTEEGSMAGIMVDILEIAEERLGIHFRFTYGTSDKLEKVLKEEGADAGGIWSEEAVFPGFEYVPTRSFVKGYYSLFGYGSRENVIDPMEVRGKTIAMIHRIGDDQSNRFIEQNKILWFETPADLFSAVISGRADYLLSYNEIAKFHMRQTLSSGFYELYSFPHAQNGVIVVHKNEPMLLSVLNKFLADLESKDLPGILSKWYGHIVKPTLILTEEERIWLADHQELIVGMPSDMPPLSFFDPKAGPQGIFFDYIKLISERVDLNIKIVNFQWPELVAKAKSREIDLFPAVETIDRTEYMAFTQEFFFVPGVIFTEESVPSISGPSWLADKRISVLENSNFHDFLINSFPQAELVPFKNVEEALRCLSEGEVEAYVGERFAASYIIVQNQIDNLKVAGSAGVPDDFLRYGVRKDWPVLVGILNKIIETISQKEHDEILHRWITVRFEHQFNYAILWRILAGVISIFLVLFFWNWQLSRSVAKQTVKLAESNQSLSDSESKFRALVEQTNDIVHSVNSEGILTYLSPQALKYGIDPEEVVSKDFFDLIVPEDREKVAADLERSITNGEEFPTEFRIIDGEGNYRWFEERGSILQNESGEITGTSGVLRDITNRKREEFLWNAHLNLVENAEICTSKQFLQQVVDEVKKISNSEKGFFHLKENLGNGLSNKTRSTYGEFDISMDIDSSNQTSSEEVDISLECLRKRDPIICNDFSNHGTGKKTDKDSSTIKRILVVPVIRKGEVVAILGVGNKKSSYDENDLDLVQRLGELAWETIERKQAHCALKQSEEELRQAQKIARIGSYSWNLIGGASNWSKETIRILGCGEADPSYELLVSMIHPDDREKAVAEGKRAFEEQSQFDLEFRIVRPDGTIRWVHDIATVVSPDEDGMPNPVYGTLQDITERKEGEIQLNNSIIELQRWHEITIGREERIQHLKDEVNELLGRLGEKDRYKGKIS